MTDNDKPKNRKFLKPITFAVAAVVASASADAMATPDIKAAVDKASQASVEQKLSKVVKDQMVVSPALQVKGHQLAWHESHASHDSHSSHSSSSY